MKSEAFLYAAYIVTWVIHVVYLGTLVRRYARLKQKIKELERLKR
jgi:CcmD family protein